VPYDQFKLMQVVEVNPSESGGIYTKDRMMSLAEIKQYYQALNASATWPWD
jgi:hypothetical protein